MASVASAADPYTDALNSAAQQGKPLVLFFTGRTCTWCHKMLHDIRPVVAETSGQVVYLEIDSDANPTLVQQYQVSTLPTYVIIRSNTGYRDANSFRNWLGLPKPTGALPTGTRRPVHDLGP